MSRVKELQSEQKKLWELVEVSQQRLLTIREELQELNSKEIENIEITPEVYLDVMGAKSSNYGTSVYHRFRNWLAQFSGIFGGGYDANTLQAHLKACFLQSKPFEEQLDILKFVPYIKSNLIGVFEETCSEGGVYHIVNIHDKPKLTITSYGREKTIKEFDTLMDALKYVYDHHPYERKRKSLEWERDNEW